MCVCFCVWWSRSASAWIKNSKSQDWTFFPPQPVTATLRQTLSPPPWPIFLVFSQTEKAAGNRQTFQHPQVYSHYLTFLDFSFVLFFFFNTSLLTIFTPSTLPLASPQLFQIINNLKKKRTEKLNPRTHLRTLSLPG